MKKVCILLVLITYVYHNARYKKREVRNNLAVHVMVMSIVGSMKTGAGKAVLFLRE